MELVLAILAECKWRVRGYTVSVTVALAGASSGGTSSPDSSLLLGICDVFGCFCCCTKMSCVCVCVSFRTCFVSRLLYPPAVALPLAVPAVFIFMR